VFSVAGGILMALAVLFCGWLLFTNIRAFGLAVSVLFFVGLVGFALVR